MRLAGGALVYGERGSLTVAHPLEIHANPLATAATALSFDSLYVPPALLDEAAGVKTGTFAALRFPAWRLAAATSAAAFTQVSSAVAAESAAAVVASLPPFARALLVEARAAEADTRAGAYFDERTFRTVTDHIEAHLAERISVEALASLTHRSPSALLSRIFDFAKTFRTRAGLLPNHYVLLRRVLRAKSQIAAGTTLTEAAYACGFTDLPHLTRTFRRFVGVTPGVFREGLTLRPAVP